MELGDALRIRLVRVKKIVNLAVTLATLLYTFFARNLWLKREEEEERESVN